MFCIAKAKSPALFRTGLLQSMVGVAGFELATLAPHAECATRLRYTPTRLRLYTQNRPSHERSAFISNNSRRTAIKSRTTPPSTADAAGAVFSITLCTISRVVNVKHGRCIFTLYTGQDNCRRLRTADREALVVEQIRIRRIISTSWCW